MKLRSRSSRNFYVDRLFSAELREKRRAFSCAGNKQKQHKQVCKTQRIANSLAIVGFVGPFGPLPSAPADVGAAAEGSVWRFDGSGTAALVFTFPFQSDVNGEGR